MLHYPGGDLVTTGFVMDSGCRLAVGSFDDAPSEDIVLMLATNQMTLVQVSYWNDGGSFHAVEGQFQDLVTIDFGGDDFDDLLLIGEASPTLVRLDESGPQCAGNLSELPGADKVVVGDRDGDGKQEFALRTVDGQVRLFTGE